MVSDKVSFLIIIVTIYFWSSIFFIVYRKEAGVEIDGHFMIRVIYNDADTYALVEAACKILSKFNQIKY